MQPQYELSPKSVTGQVLLLLDWDNLYYGLLNRFKVGEMEIENRIGKLIKCINEEMGGLMGGYGYLFAPEHLSAPHQQIFTKLGFRLFICPKRRFDKPTKNEKTGDMVMEQDTVDETIIWFAETMIGHPNFKTICLASADNDYAPLFEELGKIGILRALAPPAINSLAKTRETTRLVDLADINPATQKKMVLMLDAI